MDVTFIVELDCLLEIAFQVGTVSVVNPSNINILDIIICLQLMHLQQRNSKNNYLSK